jgi:hypothetical protein
MNPMKLCDVWPLNAENRHADDMQFIPHFGTHILRAICRTEWTEEKGSLDKASRIASFTSLRSSSLGDDEASSEFRPKIASLQKLVRLRYDSETAFSWSTATNSWRMAFFERPLSRKKGQRSSLPFAPFRRSEIR